MEFEQLYHLVHSLNSNQRRNLSLFVGSKKYTRPYKLYQSILKQSGFTNESKEKIRGTIFREPHQFHQDREKLARLIISSLILQKHGNIPPLALIREAFLQNAITLGRKALLSEIKRLTNSQSIEEWANLHDLIINLRNLHAIVIDWPSNHAWLHEHKIDSQYFESSFIFSQQVAKRKLFKLIDDLRSARGVSVAKRKEVANKVLSQLLPTYPTALFNCLALKIRMNAAYYLENYPHSARIAERYVPNLLKLSSHFDAAVIAREIRFVSVLHILLSDRDQATYYALKMGTIEASDPIAVSSVAENRLYTYSTIAVCFAECELAIVAMKELNSIKYEIDARLFFRINFNLGAAFFLNEDFRCAVKCFHSARNQGKRDPDFPQWGMHIYLALAHFELGDFDLADSMLSSAQNFARKLQRQSPKLSVSAVAIYFRNHHQPGLHQKLRKIRKNFLQLQVDPEEKRASIYFAAITWIDSILQGRSQKELLRDPVREKTMIELVSAFA